MDKVSKLTKSQKGSLNLFWKIMLDKEPAINIDEKKSLTFLKSKINQDLIRTYIKDSKFSTNTKATRINDLHVILKSHLNYENPELIKEAISYRNISKQKEKQEDKDFGVKSKNFISFDQLKSRTEEFKKLVNEDPDNKINAMAYLILVLNTQQAPLRLTINSIDIIRDKTLNNNTNNYLYIEDDNNMFYIINNDKVSKKKAPSTIKLTKGACDAIVHSLKMFPRDVLITQSTTDKKANISNYQHYLKKIIFPDIPFISQNVFRRSYATEYLSKNLSVLEMEEISYNMRTSIDQLRTIYNFRLFKDYNVDNDYKNKLGDEGTIVKTTHSIQILKDKPITNKINFNLPEWSKKYREKNKQVLMDKCKQYYDSNKQVILKKKLLKNIECGNVKCPTSDSIKKYNLKKDDLGKWY